MRLKLIYWGLLIGLLAIIPRSSARAAPAATAPPTLPSIAPFLDEHTFMVAAIDVQAVDPEAVVAWSVSMLKAGQSSQKEIDGAVYALRTLAPLAKKWIGDFGRAGGRVLLLVISSDPQTPVLLTTPVDGRVNVAALAELMHSPFGVKLPGPAAAAANNAVKPDSAKPAGNQPNAKPAAPAPPPTGFLVDRIGSSLVLGTAPTLQKARQLAVKVSASPGASPRPEFAAALAGGTGGIRVAVGLTKELRDLFAAIGPNLPAELGGEPTEVLTKRLTWAALSMDLPAGTQPKAAIRLTLEANDSDAAGRLKNILTAVFRTAVNDGELAKHPDKDKVLKMLDAKVSANRVSVELDQQELKDSAGIFGPLAIKARNKAAAEQSETHLKLIVAALRNATDETNGRFPRSLEDPIVVKYLGDTPAKAKEALTNPRYPDKGLGYVLVPPKSKTASPAETLIVHEIYETWPAGGILAGFADGHVGEIKTEGELKGKLR